MFKRVLLGSSLVFLLIVIAFPPGGMAASSPLASSFTSGADTAGNPYGFATLSGVAQVTSVTVTFAPGTANADVQCDVAAPNPNHGLGDPNNPAEWQSVWSLSNPAGTMTVSVNCTTQWVRVRVATAPAPMGITANGSLIGTATSPGMVPNARPATHQPGATLGGTATPATATMGMLPLSHPATHAAAPTQPAMAIATMPTRAAATTTTATSTTTTATSTMAASQNTCGDAPAVDQNGVSVDVWAPGLRIACGYKGYENGDDPMPPGTLMPPPRPFRFDAAVDHNEPVFGFKVYYRHGSEAPAGYGGTNGCGDVRVILHQGGDTHGMMTQYHTYQYTEVRCDAAGNPQIIDIGGQIDTGTLFPRSLPDSQRPDGPNRTTADTASCNGTTTFICATVWYAFFNYAMPGATNTGWSHMGLLVENPIALYNAANPMGYYPGTGDGTTTMLRDVQRYVPAHSASDWCAMWNTTTHVNEVVPCTTPGSWHQHVDTALSEIQVLEPANGVDHPHPVRGIVYPN